MDDSKWERWGSWGGILFVVLSAAVFILPGEPPKTSDTSQKVTQFVVDKQSEIRWAGFLGGLAVIALLWWLGSVWRLIRRAEGGTPRLAVVAIGGAVFATSTFTISGVILAAIPIIRLSSVVDNNDRIFYVIATNIGIASVFGMAAFVGAFSVAIIRSRVLPAWLGWVGAVLALVAVLGGGAVASTRDVFFYGSFAAFVGVLLWVLVVSIFMLMGKDTAPAASPVPAASAA